MSARLTVVALSPRCAAAEAALAHAAIEARRTLLPLTPSRLGAGELPLLELGGARHAGLDAVLAALELRADPEALRWVATELEPAGVRILWGSLRHAPGALRTYATGGPRAAVGLALAAPALFAAAEEVLGASDMAASQEARRLADRLDEADAWIASGTAGVAAELRIAAIVRFLSTIADLRPQLDGRRSSELAARIFPGLPGATPPRALPDYWLETPVPA